MNYCRLQMSLIKNKILIALLFCSVSFAANAFEYEEKLEPAKEAIAQKIFEEVRCIVCDGENLAGSNAEFSISMRALVRDKIKAGESEEQVMHYLTERYGNAILQTPPLESSTYLLWASPILFMLIGFLAIFRRNKNES